MSETANAPGKNPVSDPEKSSDGWMMYAVILVVLALAGWGATVWQLTGAKQNRAELETATVISHFHEVAPFVLEETRDPELPVFYHNERAFYFPVEDVATDFPREKMVPIGRDNLNRYFLFEHRDSAEGIGPNGEMILFVRDAEGRFFKVQTRIEEVE